MPEHTLFDAKCCGTYRAATSGNAVLRHHQDATVRFWPALLAMASGTIGIIRAILPGAIAGAALGRGQLADARRRA